jgi:hypothetical protein
MEIIMDETSVKRKIFSRKEILWIILAAVAVIAGIAAYYFTSPGWKAYVACTPGRLEASVRPLDRLMRQFEDQATLVSNVQRDQLAWPVSELQKTRREIEDLEVPVCLASLKELSLGYTKQVIVTSLDFMQNAAQTDVAQGIASSQLLHDAYVAEMGRLLGVPVAMPTQTTP